MSLDKEELNIGERIEIIKQSQKKAQVYPSQILDIINDDIYIISGPIHKNTIVPLHIGDIIKIVYIKENKGRYMFKAEILSREDKLIYKLKIKKISEVYRLQQRQYYRFNINIPVTKYYNLKVGSETRTIEEKCISKDLSGNGIRIMCNFNHSVGDEIKCLLEINDMIISTSGEIVRVKKIDNLNYMYEVGINFINIKKEDREIIVRFIFREERKLIEKGMI
ncbi:PilZ domain-containing protein [Sporanaerobacter acetigenes]|uniref:PilZ domain-containing protein n=1 Tax=Sporanaerobacter acetigenes TaxID=165813 RepID=UPI001304CE49|nr:PilZ domain-containing protein [Sporanaerobacter acetigenes]